MPTPVPGLARQPDGEAAAVAACRLLLGGRVQGVGFRPFVYRMAQASGLCGWVRNRIGLVEVHVEGRQADLQAFTHLLIQQAPPLARPRLESCEAVPVTGPQAFTIRESIGTGNSRIHVPPDLFTCNDCLAELNDRRNRRYRYPFINCTQCGPRYTLIRALPYDRPSTTMAAFKLCARCATEYADPADRRFHAEPVACPECGPVLEYHDREHGRIDGNGPALAACLKALRAGRIVALKGIGGYHLVCDARHDGAIARLRVHKPRPHKPLAVMFPAPAANPLGDVSRAVCLDGPRAELLLSPQRPIVLAHRKPGCALSEQLAPGLDEIGVMLPYSPLHHLLLSDFGAPLVATSANISGEPVLTEKTDVEDRLGHVAEAYLHHNRPIERPADDPVYRVIGKRPRPLRPGRGCAPVERELPFRLDRPVLAVGGHMKTTIALAWQNRIVVSPHIGDMGNARSLAVFEKTLQDLQALYGITAKTVLCDAHPGYATTRWALLSGLPLHRVYHHHAHAAVAWECEPAAEQLVFAWDGAGYGPDGTLWGGEALLGRPGAWRRFACLRPFFLPGGERAGREPWRSAAALCWETGRDWAALPDGTALLHHAWQRRINSPQTTAAGRLFDAAAALTGICTESSFEGQGPMQLEAACHETDAPVDMPLAKTPAGLWIADWEPLLAVLLDETTTAARRAARFHASLAHTLLQQARRARDEHGINRVGFSGGVFQNRILTEQAAALLSGNGFQISLPEAIPLNDAGLSFGQVIEFGLQAEA
jgi:hydrogenase maturation protein HypF